MKSHFLLLSLSVAGAFAQTQASRQAEYDDICQNKDGLKEEIIPGYWVRYNCGRVGDYASPPIKDIHSAQACAEECRNVATCEGSSWNAGNGQCVLSGSKKGVNRAYVLFLEKTDPDVPADPFPEDDEDENEIIDDSCEEAHNECTADLSTCNADLAKCKADLAKSNADLAKSKSDLAKTQANLAKCNSNQQKVDPVWERRKEAMEICGYGGRPKIQAGKYAYTTRCQRSATTGAFYSQLKLNVDQCLQACSKDTKCKSVNYVIMNDAPCKLYATGTTAAVAATDESTCPITPMIGFTPTTKK